MLPPGRDMFETRPKTTGSPVVATTGMAAVAFLEASPQPRRMSRSGRPSVARARRQPGHAVCWAIASALDYEPDRDPVLSKNGNETVTLLCGSRSSKFRQGEHDRRSGRYRRPPASARTAIDFPDLDDCALGGSAIRIGQQHAATIPARRRSSDPGIRL